MLILHEHVRLCLNHDPELCSAAGLSYGIKCEPLQMRLMSTFHNCSNH